MAESKFARHESVAGRAKQRVTAGWEMLRRFDGAEKMALSVSPRMGCE